MASLHGAHASALIPKDCTTYLIEQYHPVRDDRVRIITFAFGPEVRDAERFCDVSEELTGVAYG